MKCKTCVYWQDFSDRIFAVISNTRCSSPQKVELRRCKYIIPPNSAQNLHNNDTYMYTDEYYGCSAYKEVKRD